MKFDLSIKGATLQAQDAQSEHLTAAIEGFFKVLGTEVESKNQTITNIIHPIKEKEKQAVQLTPTVKVPDKTETVQKSSRQLPLTGSTETLTHKPFEALGQLQNDVRKSNEGHDLYRSHYDCPECGHSGTRYNRATNWFMKCHSCDTKIMQESAVLDSDPENPTADNNGNYFIGRDYFEEAE
ncbi:hypothetical protein [Viridibacillus arvi]|uniref:hypothetical protein n=1 Tax=Viridibacillus arvi TaxID=263475 RepID=UPI003D2DA57C